jgi:hypothetical protein
MSTARKDATHSHIGKNLHVVAQISSDFGAGCGDESFCELR